MIWNINRSSCASGNGYVPSCSIGSVWPIRKRTFQCVCSTACSDLIFLHGLQERSLRFRGCSVNLIGEDNICKYGSFDKAESAFPCFAFLNDISADNIGWHQVWRNWMRLKGSSRICAKVLMSSVFAKPGTPTSKQMPL